VKKYGLIHVKIRFLTAGVYTGSTSFKFLAKSEYGCGYVNMLLFKMLMWNINHFKQIVAWEDILSWNLNRWPYK